MGDELLGEAWLGPGEVGQGPGRPGLGSGKAGTSPDARRPGTAGHGQASRHVTLRTPCLM